MKLLILFLLVVSCESHHGKEVPEHRMYPEEGANVICPPEGNASRVK